MTQHSLAEMCTGQIIIKLSNTDKGGERCLPRDPAQRRFCCLLQRMCIAKLGMQHSWGCRTSWDAKNTMLVVLVAMSSLGLRDHSALAAAGDAAQDGSTPRGIRSLAAQGTAWTFLAQNYQQGVP